MGRKWETMRIAAKEKKRKKKLKMKRSNSHCLWSKKPNAKIPATMAKKPKKTLNKCSRKNTSKMNAKTHALTIRSPWKTKASNTSKASNTTNTMITRQRQ